MTYYNEACDNFLRTKQVPIRQVHIAGLFCTAYLRAATMSNAISGFSCTGIWPFNQSIWSDADFAAAERFESNESASEESISADENNNEPPTNKADNNASRDDANSVDSSSPPYGEDEISAAPVNSAAPSTSTGGMRNSVPVTTEPLPSSLMLQNARLIRTNPDGRCFFRAVVINQKSEFQDAIRDDNGYIANTFRLKMKEMRDADALRSRVISQMLENFSLYEEIDSSAVNADLPQSKCYASIEDRIAEMANPSEMIGEIEILATARTLRQPIFVYTENNVIKFGNDFPSDVLRVFYSAAESDVGHYDAVLPKASTASTSFVHPKVISPITKVVNTKRKRAEKSEVITSSPYKQKLQESEKKPKPRKRQKTNDNNVEARKAKQTKQKTTSGKTTKAKQTKQKPKDKRKSMKKKSEKQNEDDSDDDNDDCMCLICGELYSDSAAGEQWVQCVRCKNWSHFLCTKQESAYLCHNCDSDDDF